ncbi:MAG TPA: hypothetical protein VMW01_16125 [Williamwhitmania sp.]|nr:hypothetical protein [Williamwhitmania sp.]
MNDDQIKKENIKTSPNFDLPSSANQIGGYNRIRRNEVVTITFAFKGEPITTSKVTIKSDRSIATYEDFSNKEHKTDWAFVAFVMSFIVGFMGIMFAISIPAYQEYKKRSLEAAKKNLGGDSISVLPGSGFP